MQGIFNKLASYAALVGVIGAIGGGFAAFGEFTNRIAKRENKDCVGTENVELSGINQKIAHVINENE